MIRFFTKGKIFLLIIFLISIFPTNLFAEGSSLNLTSESINPGSFYYTFKRSWEKIIYTFTFSPKDKVNYDLSLLEKRLSELNYVVKNKVLDEFERSSNRFSYQAGTAVNDLAAANDSSLKDKMKDIFNRYPSYLEKLRDQNQANSSYWLLIQQDIDTLKILSEHLK